MERVDRLQQPMRKAEEAGVQLTGAEAQGQGV